MRLLAMCLLFFPLTALAQDPGQRPVVRIIGDYSGLTPEDRNSYCFWAGMLYSIGSAFCTRQQTLSTCTEVAGKRPIWISKENDKFCDRSPSLAPN